jgi:hypothetical protein
MSEERKQILDMLASGKINVEEAEKLLDAVDDKSKEGSADPVRAVSKKNPKYLIVTIKEEDNGTGKHSNVNVRVPFQMIRAGVKLASLIPSDARGKIDEALDKKGVPFDIDSLLNSENLQDIIDALADMTVDINDGKTIVKVACE